MSKMDTKIKNYGQWNERDENGRIIWGTSKLSKKRKGDKRNGYELTSGKWGGIAEKDYARGYDSGAYEATSKTSESIPVVDYGDDWDVVVEARSALSFEMPNTDNTMALAENDIWG